MATLYTQQDRNTRKTWFLMLLFLVLIIALGWVISNIYRQPYFLYGAIAFSLLLNIFSYWFSDKIVLAMYKARLADKNNRQELETQHLLENLAITAGLPVPPLYIIVDKAPNAFATGRDKNHAVVVVTSGLMSVLEKNEMEGVLAHELSHIGNRDILLSTVVVVLVGFVAIVSDMFLRSSWRGRNNDNDRAGGFMIIIGFILLALSPLAAKLIQLAISRKREFLADASGALLTRYPEGLASALRKISSYSAPMQKASEATAHLFISSPFGGKTSGMVKLFMTHPPVEERIKALLSK